MEEWLVLEKTVYDGLHYGLECDNWNGKIICTDGVIEPSYED